jgi:hypothetical protein
MTQGSSAVQAMASLTEAAVAGAQGPMGAAGRRRLRTGTGDWRTKWVRRWQESGDVTLTGGGQSGEDPTAWQSSGAGGREGPRSGGGRGGSDEGRARSGGLSQRCAKVMGAPQCGRQRVN